jgi:hypothetical protein
MGNTNLECYRVYEALECGSIPIVERRLTLDYFRTLLGEHPLPTVASWREARRFISRMLTAPSEMDALQLRCTNWWNSYKKQYSSLIGRFLAERSSDNSERLESMVSSLHAVPLWRVTELLRHHSATAFSRRLLRQGERLLKQGRFRVAHRPGVPID